MYLFVWSCFHFLSVHFGWDDVFRVWVYSVVVSWEVNKKKRQNMDYFQTCEDVDMRNVFLHEVSIIKDVFHIVFVILSHSKHACALDHVFPVTDTWRLFVNFKCSLSVRLGPPIQEGTYWNCVKGIQGCVFCTESCRVVAHCNSRPPVNSFFSNGVLFANAQQSQRFFLRNTHISSSFHCKITSF